MLKLKNRYQPEKQIIKVEAFKKLAFEIGTISKVSAITKAKRPSYEMDSDFGSSTKKSCGQFVRNYTVDELMHKQVLALTNLAPVRIAGIKSEYLTLGFPDELNDGQAIGISPQNSVPNGSHILLGPPTNCEINNSVTATAKYEDFESVEIKSGTIIDVIKAFKEDHLFALVDIGNESYTFGYIPGKLHEDKKACIGIQVPVITNLELPFLTEFFDFNSILLCVPSDEKSEIVTLLKIDKPVKNGLNLF